MFKTFRLVKSFNFLIKCLEYEWNMKWDFHKFINFVYNVTDNLLLLMWNYTWILWCWNCLCQDILYFEVHYFDPADERLDNFWCHIVFYANSLHILQKNMLYDIKWSKTMYLIVLSMVLKEYVTCFFFSFEAKLRGAYECVCYKVVTVSSSPIPRPHLQ